MIVAVNSRWTAIKTAEASSNSKGSSGEFASYTCATTTDPKGIQHRYRPCEPTIKIKSLLAPREPSKSTLRLFLTLYSWFDLIPLREWKSFDLLQGLVDNRMWFAWCFAVLCLVVASKTIRLLTLKLLQRKILKIYKVYNSWNVRATN